VIGVHLPIDRVLEGIRLAAADLSPDGSARAREAILTTDTRPKEVALRFSLGGRTATIGATPKERG
jgi:glutamate N-acetyltransferase/amino-acid N-acetyltransferase